MTRKTLFIHIKGLNEASGHGLKLKKRKSNKVNEFFQEI